MHIRALAVSLLLLAGCGRDVDVELMADQVSRLNRDLALLTERVNALEKQLQAGPRDRAEPGTQTPDQPGTQTPDQPGTQDHTRDHTD